MNRLVCTALLPLAACSSFGWEGQGAGLTPEQKKRGLKDVTALSNEYNSQQFFREVRRRSDGRNNAFGRDLMRISDFIDRHVWNYDVNDMYVNYLLLKYQKHPYYVIRQCVIVILI
jgi:hypothetical protein